MATVENCAFNIKKPGEQCNGCVNVYLPMAGWKAQMIAPTPEDPEFPYCDVWQTGLCGWRTKREAQLEAKAWAEDEELIYLGGEIEALDEDTAPQTEDNQGNRYVQYE